MTLTVRDLEIALNGRTILSSVSLQATAGSWVAVVGPNGAGKSTLLRGIAGLRPSSGEVRIAGSAVRALRPRERARLIAYAPQDPTLPEDMPVFDYALLGRSPYLSYLGREGTADRAIVAEVLDRLDLAAFATRPLGRLSGGERQRAVLARALAQQAKVLLLDEPTAALDLGHQQQVLELVDRLRLTDNLTILTTLHDLSLASQYADSLVVLSRGGIAAAGPPADVLTEELILEHFGAIVRILPAPSGRPTLTLVRPGPRTGHGT